MKKKVHRIEITLEQFVRATNGGGGLSAMEVFCGQPFKIGLSFHLKRMKRDIEQIGQTYNKSLQDLRKKHGWEDGDEIDAGKFPSDDAQQGFADELADLLQETVHFNAPIITEKDLLSYGDRLTLSANVLESVDFLLDDETDDDTTDGGEEE